MGLVRFHWDFRGPDAKRTAEHFAKHLGEFCAREHIAPHRTWVTGFPVRFIATLECEEQHLAIVRDRLRPIRAERLE
jgi:hypothetical protein